MRAIADAHDRKEAEERGEEMKKYMQELKAKKANKPRNPEAFEWGHHTPEEEEKLRDFYGLPPRERTEETTSEREQQPAQKQLGQPKAKTRRR